MSTITETNYDMVAALMSLRPGASWACTGGLYDSIQWMDTAQTRPTREEVEAEMARLKADYEYKEYQRLRAAEYPPMADYLDAVVKGDLNQQQAYIEACLAIKAKYPKPEEV